MKERQRAATQSQHNLTWTVVDEVPQTEPGGSRVQGVVPSHVSVVPGGKLGVVSAAGTPGSDVSSCQGQIVSKARQVLGKDKQTNKQSLCDKQ